MQGKTSGSTNQSMNVEQEVASTRVPDEKLSRLRAYYFSTLNKALERIDNKVMEVHGEKLLTSLKNRTSTYSKCLSSIPIPSSTNPSLISNAEFNRRTTECREQYEKSSLDWVLKNLEREKIALYDCAASVYSDFAKPDGKLLEADAKSQIDTCLTSFEKSIFARVFIKEEDVSAQASSGKIKISKVEHKVDGANKGMFGGIFG
jgi:hypothetical protein